MIARARKAKPIEMDELLLAANYLRMSGAGQEDSPEQQRTSSNAIAERDRLRIAFEYIDEAKSGLKSKNRPDFQRMLKDAAAGKFQAIIIWDINRLSREDCLDAGVYINAIRKAGVRLFTKRGEINLHDPLARIMLMLEQEGAHDYSLKLSDTSTRGKKARLAAGIAPAMPVFGYDRHAFDAKGNLVQVIPYGEKFRTPKGWTTKLRPSADALIVSELKWLFERAFLREGLNRTQAATRFRSAGLVRLKADNTAWTDNDIRDILVNPAYAGGRVAGKYSAGAFNRITDEPMILWDQHEGIVSRKTWERVQELFAARKKSYTRRTQTDAFLRGVLRCGHCGQSVYAMRGPDGATGYGCSGFGDHVIRGRRQLCEARPKILAAPLERTVVRLVFEAITDPSALKQAEVAIADAKKASDKPARVQSLQRQIDKLKAEISRGQENLLRASNGDDFAALSAMLATRRVELRRLERQVEAMQQADAGCGAFNAKAAIERLRTVAEQLLVTDLVKVRAAIEELVEQVTFRHPHDTTYRGSRYWEFSLTFKPSLPLRERTFTQEDVEPLVVDLTARAARELVRDGRRITAPELERKLGITRDAANNRLSRAKLAGYLVKEKTGSYALPR